MPRVRPALFVVLAAACGLGALVADEPPALYRHPLRTIAGEETTLAPWRGKVLLIVNTASRCGFTGQYEGLEQLHQRYQERGLAVLGFPCNDFGGQEPGSEEEVATFCRERFQVSFPLFAKVHVRGEQQHPLWKELTDGQGQEALRGAVRWNFSKFLVSRSGRLVARFDSATDPLDPALLKAIEAQLAEEVGQAPARQAAPRPAIRGSEAALLRRDERQVALGR